MDLQTAAQQVFNCIWCKITTLCLHHNAKVCPGNALLNSSPVKAGTPTSKHVNTPLWHAWKQQPCPSQNKAFCSVDKSLLCLNQAEGQQKDLTDNALTRDHKTWTSKACRPACNPCPSYRRKCTHNTIQKKKGNGVFGTVGRCHIPHQKTNFFGLEGSKRSENSTVLSLFLSAIKNNRFFIPFTICHCEGMQYSRPIANAASQTLTISVSASYSSPSASPPSFFPSWCLFFIWSDDSTNTVSWRLLLSHQSSDSNYKD